MYHKHFKEIESTQIFLKDNLEKLLENGDKDILISCSKQTHGIGSKTNSWEMFPNSLAFSFTLKPQNKVATLTPLEIAVILVCFFKKNLHRDVFLKWPNDLLTADGKKCGGIICQFINSSTIIAGIGINLGKFEIPLRNFQHGLSQIDPGLVITSSDQEKLPAKIYSEILNNRIDSELQVKELFNKYCFHQNRRVSIIDNDIEYKGIYRGIGEIGEAIIEIDSDLKKFVSGILSIL